MIASLRRRQILSLIAATSFTGCVDHVSVLGPKEIEAARLQPIVEKAVPSAPETVPVPIEASFVATQLDEAQRLLSEVPAPFDSDEIPNGAIRERMNRLADVVDERLRTVSDGATPFERLHHAGYVRADARELHAAWQTIDAEFTADEIRRDAESIRGALDTFASRWSYLGDDPVRAVRVHGEIERYLLGARNWATFEAHEQPTSNTDPFEVAEMACDLERARFDLAVARYLFERLREDIDRERTLRPTFEKARRELYDRVRQRSELLPERTGGDSPTELVDRNVNETAGVWALHSLYEGVTGTIRRLDTTREVESSPSVSLDILEAFGTLVSLRGFEQLRTRIEDGDTVEISSVSDLRTARRNAVAAVESARETTRRQALIRHYLPRYVNHISWGDEQFEGRSGTIPVPSIQRDASEYVIAATLCRVLPEVSESVAAVLRGA
ncbi:hypothetical protein [Haloprofundus halobius]|uniref:hypothetical protein n=1 Tax=Haloprofundus halobius TaxID=2876194 RepID=UPI001CCB35D2|nr:hypothetical protein [Haloprofundus halobius]